MRIFSRLPLCAATLLTAIFSFQQTTLAEPKPLQILYVSEVTYTSSETNYALLPGQSLAGEAIYFDHRTSAGALTKEYLGHFSAIFLATTNASFSTT